MGVGVEAARAARASEPEPTSFTGGVVHNMCLCCRLAILLKQSAPPMRHPASMHSLPVWTKPKPLTCSVLSSPPTVHQAVDNPARVAPGQRKYITFPEGQRFAPIRPAPGGELLLSVEPGECWLSWDARAAGTFIPTRRRPVPA